MSRQSVRARPTTASASPQPNAPSSLRHSLMPLGAIAAGFGLLNAAAFAQGAPAAVPPATSASAPGTGEGTTLSPVSVKAKAETDATSVQATTSSIGKGKQEIRDIPQSVTVMTEKLIEDRKLTTLKEALHHVAGISFAATENGTDQDIRIRGFPVATVGDLFIDGMRDPSQYDRDTFNYERVEVLRGSASMLFGRGSTGGVVNQVTKKPQLADINQISLSGGTGDNVRMSGDFNARVGETSAFRLNVMQNSADNWGAKVDKHGIAPTMSWGIGTSDELTVGLFYLNVNNVPRAGIQWLEGRTPNVDPKNFYGFASDYLLGRATTGTISHTHRFEGGGSLKTQFRTGTFDRQQWGSVNRYATGTTQANLSDSTVLTRVGLTPRKDRYNTTYFQSDYSNTFDWGGMKHEILTGVDAAHEKANRFGATNVPTAADRPPTTVGTPNDGARLPNTLAWRDTQTYKSTSVGAYVQDVAQVSEHWKVLAGLRWDSFDGDFGQTAYPAGAPITYTSTSMSESLLSYRAGLLYQPSDAASFHVSYGTSFNTSADTYQFTTALNANTPPEKSRNFEIGAKLDWLDGKLSTRAAFFNTEKFNERNTDQDSAGTAYLLSGARYTRGVEFDIVGKPAPGWEVYLSLAYNAKAYITKAASTAQGNIGRWVGLVPKRSGSLWVSHQATEQLRVAVGANGASKTYPLTVANVNAASGWGVADAMVEYKFSPDVIGQLNVTNMFNRSYGDQLYPGFAVLGEPRKVTATLAMQF